MSNELPKSTRFELGIIGLGSLCLAAAAAFLAYKTSEQIDTIKAIPSEEIKAIFAETCKEREFKKNFNLAIKGIKAQGQDTILLTANQNSKSFKACPEEMRDIAIKSREAEQEANWIGGGFLLAFGCVGVACGVFGGRRKETPKP